MNKATKKYVLLAELTPGKVYRRDTLASLSHSIDRELKELVLLNKLTKVGPGLYYYPKISRFGVLPPDPKDLLTKFLDSKDFLVLTDMAFNTLGLNLTQLNTKTRVYNTKRHETLPLDGQYYAFVRPNNGYPKKLTKEFLLVDLFNNINLVGEDPNTLKNQFETNLNKFDKKYLLSTVETYGKVGTKKYFRSLLDN